MKKIIPMLLIFSLLFISPTFAFLYEIQMLTREEIKKLPDDALIEQYINAKIEEKASSEFHQAAGFSSAKEYEKRKQFLRYLFELRYELNKRQKTEADSIDEQLK